MASIRYLSHAELVELVSPAHIVDAVRDGYRQRGNGAPAKPRTTLTSDDPTGMCTSYLAILPDSGYMGGYTYAAGFAEADAWFLTPLFDAESGIPVAILDGAWMNPYKTGAASAVAVDALARPDATTLGLIGSGSQAYGQLRTIATVRDLDRVLVYSPTRAHRETFATEADNDIEAAVTPVGSAEEVVAEADILVTATTASEPVFEGHLLEPGTHVTTMGQYHPDRREVDATTIARSTYVPDLKARIHQDAGAFMAAREHGLVTNDHVHAELGEVVAGVAPGRTSQKEITLFDSGGTGIETVAAASLLYERAREVGRGIELSITPASEAFPGPNH